VARVKDITDMRWTTSALPRARSLSDLKNRSENSPERGQFLTISPGNSRTIAQESGKKWTALADLQPISFNRLLKNAPPEPPSWTNVGK